MSQVLTRLCIAYSLYFRGGGMKATIFHPVKVCRPLPHDLLEIFPICECNSLFKYRIICVGSSLVAIN